RSTPRATTASRAGSRTCTSRAGRTCIRPRSRPCCTSIRTSATPPSSACRTSAGARSASRSSSPTTSPRRSSSPGAPSGSRASRCRPRSASSPRFRATRSARSRSSRFSPRSRHDGARRRRARTLLARRRDTRPPARGRGAGLRRRRLPRRVDREDHRGRRRWAGDVLPLLRLEEGRLRRARPRPEPPRAPRDEGGVVAGGDAPRGGAARLRRVLPLHRRAPGALPDRPPGRVRLAGDAALPLREARRRVRRRPARVDRARRGRRHRPRGQRVGAHGRGRDARHALHPLGRRHGARAGRAGARAHHPLRPGGVVTRISLAATAAYLPERWMTAAEVGERSGIPEAVIVEKFGLRGKHIAAADEHVSDLSVRAAQTLLEETDFDPEQIDVVMYYGSMWKDYAVWQAAPWIAHRLGASRAYAVEYDNVSCGTPVALRIAR